jgi:tRNA(Ile)-lysidine synthase
VLLSGGRDSVCLLDLAVTLCGPADVRALHVDYGLREESAADAESCAALCRMLGVALELEHAQRPAGGNLHAWARDVRYGAGMRLAAAAGAVLAAGHTATDQAETVLYRLASSPGRRALVGMSPRSGRLVRPLLGVTREETAAHCEARGLPWVEDRSNDDDAFALANVLRTSELLRDEAEVLDVVVETALAGRAEIELEVLAALPRALARLVLRRLAEDALGAPCGRVAARLEEVLALDGALDVGDGARVVVDSGMLHVEATPPLAAR